MTQTLSHDIQLRKKHVDADRESKNLRAQMIYEPIIVAKELTQELTLVWAHCCPIT